MQWRLPVVGAQCVFVSCACARACVLSSRCAACPSVAGTFLCLRVCLFVVFVCSLAIALPCSPCTLSLPLSLPVRVLLASLFSGTRSSSVAEALISSIPSPFFADSLAVHIILRQVRSLSPSSSFIAPTTTDHDHHVSRGPASTTCLRLDLPVFLSFHLSHSLYPLLS